MKKSVRFGRQDDGFTLLELLVVLAILGLLAAIVAPRVISYLGSSRSKTAAIQVKNIAASLELYRLDAGRYPNEQEGLGALIKAPPGAATWSGPYLSDKSALSDPWGRPYHYAMPSKHGGEFDVFTYGADDKEGGSGEDKDVGNW
jgi:general secretion pathway protein G